MRDFNFFEPYVGKKKVSSGKQWLNYRIIAVISIVALLLPGISFIYLKFIEKDIEKIKEVVHSSESVQQRKAVESKLEEINKMKESLSALEALKKPIAQKDVINDLLIYTIRDAIPRGVFFQRMLIDTQKVEIQGTAENKIAIAEFQHNLETVMDFQDIFVPSIAGIEGNYNFTITFTIKDVN